MVLGPNGEKWAIEVKTKPPAESELKGLFQFCKLNSEFQPIVVCPNVESEGVNLPKVRFLSAERILKFSRDNSISSFSSI